MRFRALGRSLLTLIAACLLMLALAPAAESANWATFGNSPARTGRATGSRITASTVKHLAKAWTAQLGADVDGQPLYASDVATAAGVRNLYLVATEAGSVFAFDARNGKLVWRSELGSVHLGCNQIPGGIYGATGAMTYDASRQTLFAASTNQLWALDVRTGQAEPGWPLTLPFDPQRLHVWGALAQLGSNVYVPTASYCDHPPYKGGVIRVDVTTRAVTPWYPVPVPGDNGGGSVWGWGGVAIDPAGGDVWAATGNAIVSPGVTDERAADADALVDLTADLSQVRAVNQPANIPASGDYDFGATPLLFRAPGCPPLVAAVNKDGDLYLWRRDNLAAGPYHTISLAFPATLFGVPAWNAAAGMLYLQHRLPRLPLGAAGLQARRRLPSAASLDARFGLIARLRPDDREQHGQRRHRQRTPAHLQRDQRRAAAERAARTADVRAPGRDRRRHRRHRLDAHADGLPAARHVVPTRRAPGRRAGPRRQRAACRRAGRPRSG
jgi:hypothetical protein